MGAIRNFNFFVIRAKINDIPLQGMAFTWPNFRDNAAWSRLDRFLISPEFLSFFQKLCQRGLPRSVLDQNQTVLEVPKIDWCPILFHLFNFRLEDTKMIEGVRKGWNNCKAIGSAGGILVDKLKMVKARLKRWNRVNKV
ncbi:hypothetical protein Ddye_009901 [Dipteronia dyeriana]|uniref:Uncharacterized protein n=1 Tax=Dipteronia dyeriana TaxID=168575 RepID=A0AAD9XCC7_9ROSI|nr:hypothetical protein Ddye_009901 [Dipteronia dyeriana]